VKDVGYLESVNKACNFSEEERYMGLGMENEKTVEKIDFTI